MTSAILICSSDSFDSNDVVRECTRCGTRIFIRPQVDQVKIKVCKECGDFLFRECNGIEFDILPETVKEIRHVLQLGGIFRDRAS